jgi:hypothetical protein
MISWHKKQYFRIILFFIYLFKTWPPLPEPRPEENLPDPASNHKFVRNVVWTFEDIQMLIGTDMPIFGGSTHPCISLRLRYVSAYCEKEVSHVGFDVLTAMTVQSTVVWVVMPHSLEKA